VKTLDFVQLAVENSQKHDQDLIDSKHVRRQTNKALQSCFEKGYQPEKLDQVIKLKLSAIITLEEHLWCTFPLIVFACKGSKNI
jgi:hypothetical protein